MTLTKANSDVIDVPSVSGALATESTPAGIRQYVDSAIAPKAPINNPTFTGTVSAPTALANDNSTKVATTAHVAANSFGLGTKTDGTGPKIIVSASAPAGGSDGDVWLQYI